MVALAPRMICRTALISLVNGHRDLSATRQFAEAVIAPLAGLQKGGDDDDPVFVAALRVARSFLQLMSGDLASALQSLSIARALADRMESGAHQASSRFFLVVAHAETGSCHEAEASARELRELCEPNGRQYWCDLTAPFLATSRLSEGRIEESVALLGPLVNCPDRLLATSARSTLAHALVAAGDLDAAKCEAHAALDVGSKYPPARSMALGALALVALQRGELTDVLAFAEQGLDAGSRGMSLRDGSILRLARAEALHALGRENEAHMAIREARDRILSVATTLDEAFRASYLANVKANARTLELVREWRVD
jgi:hypothetical protein